MTWAEGSRLTNWATQAPLLYLFEMTKVQSSSIRIDWFLFPKTLNGE